MEDAAVDRTASTSAVAAIENPVEDGTSVVSIVCRICLDDNKDESLITPCQCKGTVAFVHKSCLGKWLTEADTTVCELCDHVYETEQVVKYTTEEYVRRWLRHETSNIVCFVLVVPLPAVIFVILTVADAPTEHWTFVPMLIMPVAIIIFGYYIFLMFFVAKMHKFATSQRLGSNFGSSSV